MEVAAEAFVFIVAGSETMSRTMSFCLYELAMNPAVQARVLEEVDSLREISYDSITNLEYLDMVVDGMLCLKYSTPPPRIITATIIARSHHGSHKTNVKIFNNSQPIPMKPPIDLIVPLIDMRLHAHFQVYTDLFPDPERFSKENKANIKPYSYMPFGEGPRFCIGLRFGKMTVKTGLAMLLRKFQVLRSPSTPETIKFHPRTVITTALGGIWLKLQDRSSLPEKLLTWRIIDDQ
ncbi:hypothetical protein J6590_065339 [Homalodisca vitripennis]|nr:hypothetical protein J6590_065339 [Homalodisca vitripennis]